jgi:hypothetical protein
MDFINHNMKHGRIQQKESEFIDLARINDKETASVIGKSHV